MKLTQELRASLPRCCDIGRSSYLES